MMGGLCNFGECELPQENRLMRHLETDDSIVLSDFECFYRNYTVSVKNEIESDPELQFKVECLCKRYSVDDLVHSIHDLEWNEESAKRNYYHAVKEHGDDTQFVMDMKSEMETVLLRLLMLKLALEQKNLIKVEDDDEYGQI